MKVIDRLNTERIGNFNDRSIKDLSPLSKAWQHTRNPVEISDNIYNNRMRSHSNFDNQRKEKNIELFNHLFKTGTQSWQKKLDTKFENEVD